MRILLVSVKTTESKGGIAAWTEHYVKACENSGAEVQLVNTVTVGNRLKNASAKRSFIDEWKRTARIMKDLKVRLNANSFDVAHLNTSIGVFGIIRDYFVAKKISKKRIPIFLHFHCDIPFWTTNSLIKHFLHKIIKISTTSLVLCENSKRYLYDEFTAESEKVPNFVDELLIVDNKKVNDVIKEIFFVGRISKLKGAEEIFELAKRFPNITFELAGEICDDIDKWTKPANINFLGMLSHDEVLSHLDSSDVFLFPTYTEGFSMALAESMARGVPVITTDVGANLDMIEDSGGVVVKIGDVEAMENAIHAIENPETRAKMSKWNIQKVKSEYTSQVVLSKLLEIYGEAGKC